MWQTPIHPSQPISNGPSGKCPSPPPPRGARTGFLQLLSAAHSLVMTRLCPPLDQGAWKATVLLCMPPSPFPLPRPRKMQQGLEDWGSAHKRCPTNWLSLLLVVPSLNRPPR